MKYLYIALILSFCSLLGYQSVYSQAKLGFTDYLDCTHDTYCVDLEISAATGTVVSIGTSSFLTTYDATTLSFKSYTPADFDANTSNCGNIWANQKTDVDAERGLFGITLRLINHSGACVLVNNIPKKIGTLCFDIKAQGAIPNITFDAQNTYLNRHSPDNGTNPITITTIDTLNVPNSLACDCSGVGQPCDDQNVFTIQDKFDIFCNCAGELIDADVDGIYDGVDNCLDVFYEAENGSIIGAAVENDEPQYHGTGFIDYKNSNGDTVAIPITINDLGIYNIILRYANGDNNDRSLDFFINTPNVTTTLNFPFTGSWETWDKIDITYALTTGTHTLYFITNGVQGPNLDRVSISSCGNCGLAGTTCDDGDPCTDSDTYDVDCNCKGVYSDTDQDGICDNQDICPNGDDQIDADMDGLPDACDDCDNNLIGTVCDDGDPCTINDIFDANCQCLGTFSGNDADNDGVCDTNDACPGFDDQLDVDSDGIPDDCDPCNDLTVGQPCDDGNPCTILDVITPGCGCGGIPINLELTHHIDTIKCNGDLANIYLTPEHMVGGVYYQWNTGAYTENLLNLHPGIYTVTATDWRNCSVSETITITAPMPIDLDFTSMASSGTDGAIDLFVSGGTAPYTYLWDNAATTQDLNNLVADRFHVTVTDSLDCTVDGFADVLVDTLCLDTMLQYEYGAAINLQTRNTNFGPAVDGYIRFGHDDAPSSVSLYYDFPEFGKYEFNIRHAEKSRDRMVNIYLDGVLKQANLFIPKTGNDSIFQYTTFIIDSIPPGVHTITTERATTQNNNPRLDYLAICKTDTYDCLPLTGNTCDDGNPCTLNDVISNCNCAGIYADADGDGVCDTEDLCPGSDDAIDSDADGIPDGCDNCYAFKYEAEIAQRISVSRKTGGSGWTGTGYADYNSLTGDTVRFTIDAQIAGNFNVNLRYSINANDRYLDVAVNRSLILNDLHFPNTGSGNTKWTDLPINLTLNKGLNIIDLYTDGNHGPNLDFITLCYPDLIHDPVIAQENDGFEEGLNHWTDINISGNSSAQINTSTEQVLCGFSSLHYSGASGIEKLYADIDFLRVNEQYTLHFYAAGGSAMGYIGLPDQIYNGQSFNIDATAGSGEFVHHSVTFTALAPTMRIWFEFFPNTNLYLDAFSWDNANCLIDIQAKAFLSGPFDSHQMLMWDSLRQAGLIPLSEPYSDLPNFEHQGRGGQESIQPVILQTTGQDAIVDWVLLELRDKADSTNVLATKSALIQRDGDIVDLDGVSAVKFRTVYSDNYYLAIRHRNHTGIMTASPISLGNGLTAINFSDPATPVLGTHSQQTINTITAMWAGDINADGKVKYNGWRNDRMQILAALNYTNPDSIIYGVYTPADVNLDGQIKYNGTDNDRVVLLNQVGLTQRNDILIGQIPGLAMNPPAPGLEIRAMNDGTNNIIDIQMRCTQSPCPDINDKIGDLVFGLKWNVNAGIDLGFPANTYQIEKSAMETPSGLYEFQAFGLSNLLTNSEDWATNEWKTITSLSVEHLDADDATVEICEPSLHETAYPNIQWMMGATAFEYTPIISNTVANVPNISGDYVDNDGDNVPNAQDCAPNDNSIGILTLNDSPLPSGQYQADNLIESTAIIADNADVTYKATRSIALLPGFTTSSNTLFFAEIEDICNQLNASISATAITCAGNADGSAIASASNGDGNYSYLWNTGATTASITNLTPGTYTVTITDGIGRSESTFVNIDIDQNDADNDQITDGCDCDPNNANDGMTILDEALFKDSVYTAPNKMTATGIIAVDTNAVLKATYSIELLAGFQAAYGSSLVADIDNVCIPPAIPLLLVNDDGDIDTTPEALQLLEDKAFFKKAMDETIAFFPNPTTSQFQIKSAQSIIGYSVLDISGRTISKGQGNRVNISNLSNGTYLVRVFLESGKESIGLIVKQ